MQVNRVKPPGGIDIISFSSRLNHCFSESSTIMLTNKQRVKTAGTGNTDYQCQRALFDLRGYHAQNIYKQLDSWLSNQAKLQIEPNYLTVLRTRQNASGHQHVKVKADEW